MLENLLTDDVDEIAKMSHEDRALRVRLLIQQSHDLMDDAIKSEILDANRKVTAICVLYSGGNDSTTLAHMFRNRADYAIHVNTGIGIEETREFVRSTCGGWNLPLMEEHPPEGSTYRELVLDQGFPGPGHHWKMYQRLKQRGLEQARKKLVGNRGRTERVVFLAGRRREESKRRAGIPDRDRVGAMVFISPLVNWTKLDLNTYRVLHPDVPRNPVSDTLHMSGECLCGAFAHRGELDEIGFWYPETAKYIRELEQEVIAAGHPSPKCHWGWGADKGVKPSKSGPMCTSCDSRFTGEEKR